MLQREEETCEATFEISVLVIGVTNTRQPNPWVGRLQLQPQFVQLLVATNIRNGKFQKNPRAHKNKIGTPPPPEKPQIPPPPLKRGILWTWRFSCRKNAIFPGAHKIGAAISGPRIADKNFTDTKIFLKIDPIQKKKKHSKFQATFLQTLGQGQIFW